MTGNRLSPSFYIMFTAALSIIALIFVHRRRYPREYPVSLEASSVQQSAN
jgi:hypothetical protein